MAKKIMAVSLVGKPKVKCLAAYDGEVLVLHSMEVIGGFLKAWKKPLIEEIEARQRAGFEVIIEDLSGHFEDYATTTTFDTVDEAERRTMLNVALDHYFSLESLGDASGSRRGSLIFGKGLERWAIHGNTIDVDQDDKGRNRYTINQDSFTGHHRSMLLAVLSATVLNTMSNDYITSMYGAIWTEPETPLPPALQAITLDQDVARQRRYEKARSER